MVRVRTATPEDVSAISEITVRGWQVAFRGLFPDEYLDALDPRDRDAAFAERLKNGLLHYAAVALEDEVVGFVGLRPPDDEGLDPIRVHEIWGLYVEPELIGTGVGRVLMDHALAHLRTGSWEQAILWTLKDVDRTCRFYEAAGWYRDGEEKVWEIPEGNPVTLVRYTFDLISGTVDESDPTTNEREPGDLANEKAHEPHAEVPKPSGLHWTARDSSFPSSILPKVRMMKGVDIFSSCG